MYHNFCKVLFNLKVHKQILVSRIFFSFSLNVTEANLVQGWQCQSITSRVIVDYAPTFWTGDLWSTIIANIATSVFWPFYVLIIFALLNFSRVWGSLRASLLCVVGEVSGICDCGCLCKWQVTGDRWHVTGDMQCATFDMWQVNIYIYFLAYLFGIFMVLLLLIAHAKRFRVFCMQDFCKIILKFEKNGINKMFRVIIKFLVTTNQ